MFELEAKKRYVMEDRKKRNKVCVLKTGKENDSVFLCFDSPTDTLPQMQVFSWSKATEEIQKGNWNIKEELSSYDE
ncbi:hypothetical protein [Bacillus toyonensis]|uniref:hypothetical protein n=1 Tax=Bacillus toyonensis TaxID=155322 RepID=UPI000BF287AA|nr:hypothetical protein [Bacillus toyonensis]PGF05030.1 hypothetical protein COM61_00925 [Bacillus toyonensis]